MILKKFCHHQWKGSLFWSWWWLRIRTYNSHHQWHKRMRTNSHHHQLSLSPCVKTEAARYQNYDINMGWFVGSSQKKPWPFGNWFAVCPPKTRKKTLKVLALLCLSASISMNCLVNCPNLWLSSAWHGLTIGALPVVCQEVSSSNGHKLGTYLRYLPSKLDQPIES